MPIEKLSSPDGSAFKTESIVCRWDFLKASTSERVLMLAPEKTGNEEEAKWLHFRKTVPAVRYGVT